MNAEPQWRRRFRNYILDQHSPPTHVVETLTLADLDVARDVETFKAAHCDSIWCFAKGHWGYAWYESETLEKWPGLAVDYLAEHCRYGHDAGMEVVAYYSVGFDNHAGLTHPDWNTRDPDGAIDRCPFVRPWYHPCVNTPYRAYMLGHIREIASGYPIDGLFLDIFMPYPCYCPSCAAAHQEQRGEPLLRPDERDAARQRRWVRWLCDTWRDLFFEIKRTVEDCRPGTPVYINGPGLNEFAALPAMPLDYLLLSDYPFAESPGGASATGAWVRGAVDRDFQQSMGDLSHVYDPQNLDVCKLETSCILAQGGRVSVFSEAQHPDGTLDDAFFAQLGQIYGEIARKQPYVYRARSVREIAVLITDSLYVAWKPDGVDPRLAAAKGTLDTLATMRLPYDVIHGWDLTPEILGRYRVLIAPHVRCLDERQAATIRAWVRDGGALLATGECGVYDPDGTPVDGSRLADVLGMRVLGERLDYSANLVGSYLHVEDHPITASLPKTRLDLIGPQLRVEATTGRPLGWHALPAVAETDERWINWHSAPPAVPTRDPAIILNHYGRGRAIYVTNPLFDHVPGRAVGGSSAQWPVQPQRWPRELLRSIVDDVLPEPRIAVAGPDYLEATFFEQARENRLVVHLLNSVVRSWGGAVHLADGAEIRIHHTLARPRAARVVWPEDGPVLTLRTEGPYTMCVVPAPDIHIIVVFDR